MSLYRLLAVGFMATVPIACGLNSSTAPEKEAVTPITELAVPTDFNWSASQRSQLEVTLVPPADGRVATQGKMLLLLDAQSNQIARAIINENRARFNLLLPPGNGEMYLHFPVTHNIQRIGHLQSVHQTEMPVAYSQFQQDNGLEYAFGTSSNRPAAGKLAQLSNQLVNGDFEDNSLPLIDLANTLELFWDSGGAKGDYSGGWTGIEMSENGWDPSINGSRLRLGHPNMDADSYVVQDIAASAGDSLYFSADVRQPAGNSSGNLSAWLVISAIYPSANANVLATTHMHDTTGQEYKDWTNVSIAAQLPSGASGFRVIIYVNAYTKQTHFDNAVVTTNSVVDSDGDGVADGDDDYPDDPTVSVRTSVPTSGYAHLAFEDMWPQQGDYDFNDLVIAHKIDYAYNAYGAVVKADVEVQIKALGALYHNGLALRFTKISWYNNEQIYVNPEGESVIASISGDNEGQDTETANTIIVADDVFSILDSYYQNNDVGPDGDPQTLSFTVDFTEYGFDDMGEYYAGFIGEFFIYRSDDRSHEIHLPGFPPSTAANDLLFGTEDDDSAQYTNWYKTASGLPWSLEIVNGAAAFAHPVEYVSIETAYSEFSAWAESGGTSNPTWYDNPTTDKVYDWNR